MAGQSVSGKDFRAVEHAEAIRILLRGTCGINLSLLERETGVTRWAIYHLMAGEPVDAEALDALGLFIFRQMNADVVLSPEDFEHIRLGQFSPWQ